jgi:hypothetical protein
MRRFLPFALFTCVLIAETKVKSAVTGSSVRMPLLGYAIGSSPLELRAIAGVVGVDILADPTPVPAGIRALMIAPGQQYGLATRGDEGQLGWISLNEDGAGDYTPIPGALAQADRVSFNSSGSAAVLYSGASQRLQVIGGLPNSTRIIRDLDASAFAGTLSALAISDDASVVLLGLSMGESGFVAVIGNESGPRTVFNASSVAAIRFLPGAHDAVVADSQMNQITLLSGETYSPRVLAGHAQGVSTPLDLETSTDGSRVFVANSAAGNILMIGVATGNSTALECGFAPAEFRRLAKSAISVTAQDGDGVWVMDTDAAGPWVAFVPKLQ